MNAKVLKTKSSLLSALSRLLETKNLDDITVSQLCKEARINRTTFYKYYAVPADIITEFAEETFDKVIYSDSKPPKTVYEYMLTICQIGCDNRNLMTIYINANGNLMQIIYKLMMRQKDALGFMSEPVNNFIAGGIGSTIMAWMLQGYVEPPEKVARDLTDFISCLIPET